MSFEQIGRVVIEAPGVRAVIETSRPGPGTDWTTTVDASGIELDGYRYTTDGGTIANEMHRACVDEVLVQIDRIPTIRLPRP